MAKDSSIAILTTVRDVEHFIDDVRKAADANRVALGFFAASVYRDFALQGTLFVATFEKKYAGHLAFGGKFPHVKVRQLNVVEKHRRLGIGRKLLDALVDYATQRNITTLQAAVATDLPANDFWEKAGLAIVRVRAGGRSRNRRINIRERLLQTTDLLSPVSVRGVSEINGVEFNSVANAFTYALDLNFLLDALSRRGPEHDDATTLIAATLRHAIRLYVTPEAKIEILRNADPAKPDPLREFAASLPELPILPTSALQAMVDRLRPHVFPKRTSHGQLKPRELSDLRHLAYCAEHRIGTFVTRDEEMLSARDDLRRDFGLDIVAPSDIVDDVSPMEDIEPLPATIDRDTRIGVCRTDRAQIKNLASNIVAASPAAAHRLADMGLDERFAALIALRDGEPVAVAWGEYPAVPKAPSSWAVVFLNPSVDDIVISDQFLANILRGGANQKVSRYEFDLFNAEYCAIDHLKNRGCLEGLRGTADPIRLRKLAIAGYVDTTNWSHHAETVATEIGIAPTGPALNNPSAATIVTFTADQHRLGQMPWFQLETITGPVLYLFRSTSALLVPIDAAFSEELLGSRQGNVFALQSARFRTERVYFRTASRLKAKQGMPVVFRETLKKRGSGAAIGCARLTHYGIYATEVASTRFRNQGVIDLGRFECGDRPSKVCVLAFDNFQEFAKPVSLKKLHEIKAVTGAQNVTSETIDIDVARQILELAFPRGK